MISWVGIVLRLSLVKEVILSCFRCWSTSACLLEPATSSQACLFPSLITIRDRKAHVLISGIIWLSDGGDGVRETVPPDIRCGAIILACSNGCIVLLRLMTLTVWLDCIKPCASRKFLEDMRLRWYLTNFLQKSRTRLQLLFRVLLLRSFRVQRIYMNAVRWAVWWLG